MTGAMRRGSPNGVLGVFFLLLGAGLIFDADWYWRGGATMALGISCLASAARRDLESRE